MQNTVLREGTALDAVLAALAKSNKIADPRMAHLDLSKATFGQPGGATTGLNFYDLEPGAKHLYPVLTPLRNETPRVSGKGGIQANWRAITGINTGNLRVGVSGGHRGGNIAVTTADYTASYKGIGLESSVDFEAQYAGMGFDDIRAIGAMSGLEALMLGEEILILGGNGSLALGTTPTPAGTGATTGGAMAANTYSVRCVALTLEGYLAASVAGGVPGSLTRVNADASSDTFGGGSAQQSAAASVVVGGSGAGSIAATVAAVKGAVGYAWFWGVGSGNEVLGAITTAPAYLIATTAATGTQLASTLNADNSINNLVFDGIITQACKTGSGAYIKDLANATLTGDNAGGIVEIDAALKDRWDNYRLSPDTIWVNSQEAQNIGVKITANGASSGMRFVVNVDQAGIGGGILVKSYLNKFSLGGGQVLDVRIHPNMPSGMIVMTTKKLPYPIAQVANVWQIRTRQDYYQIEWPLITRQYQYGVYADQVLQHYFPPSICIISGIKNG